MRYAILLLGMTASLFVGTSVAFGYDRAYVVAFGVVVALALSISGTFFWLWLSRATPLALGMGFSWLGTTGVLGWWWVFQLLHNPPVMRDNAGLFIFVAAYFVGAILHFQVIRRSLGLRSYVLLLPLGGAVVAALLTVI